MFKIMRLKSGSKHSVISLIIIVSFTLFSWGFSYNILKRLGFDEGVAQFLGIILAIVFFIIVESFTRYRLKHL